MGPVTLSGATEAQRVAVARLLGRPAGSGATVTVRLEAVDAVLCRSGVCPDGLGAAVVALTGPVDDRAAAAARLAAAWREAFAPVERAAAGRDDLAAWVAGLQASGAVRRIVREPERARELLGRLGVVLEALPVDPAEPIGRFAERLLGSAHALDPGGPVHGLALSAARVLGGEGDGSGAEWRRRVWASVGLVLDEVSTTVLVLNLPVAADTATGRMLAGLRETGEPAVVTLRQLRSPLRVSGPAPTISVCENPVVVAEAADRLGADSGPLVCVGGQPGVAALTLLRQLADVGAAFRYHGDFDWPGVRIANHLAARLPIAPWRFDEGAYREVSMHGSLLTGEPATPTWDLGLGTAMAEIGRAVEEERVVGDLLQDLRAG
ncbi:TIGR02679 family protein [Pseudonocardia asaccharolytica]|uniref:TIGR02679 family protein n=1 Tax=Pseudonocardia asaccharolytica TaxID=54010 RepID=UPI0024814AA6|nr:TIGR02679 family protein [Pseudonocardia asaccharolytica]